MSGVGVVFMSSKFLNFLGVLFIVGLPFTLIGCSTPSTVDVITGINHLNDSVDDTYQNMLATCQLPGNGGYNSVGECNAAAATWYTDQKTSILVLERQTLEEDWEAARDTRKEVEKTLSRKEKKLKIKVTDKVDIELETTNGDPESPQGSAGTVVVGTTPIGDPIQLVDMNWALSGLMSVEYDGILIDGTVSGSLFGVVGKSGSLAIKGKLTGGSFQQTFSDGAFVVYTVNTKESSYIVSDASTGAGYIDFVADANYSSDAWASVLQSSIWFRLPIVVDLNGNFTVSTGLVSPDSLYPYDPYAYTDYNLDGQWDLATDLSAFMAGWAAGSPRADINIDGVWDQLDVDLWNAHFQEDVLAMQ
jgi:hypothetical protein